MRKPTVLANTNDFPGGGSWSASAGIIFSNRGRLEQVRSEGGNGETKAVCMQSSPSGLSFCPMAGAIFFTWSATMPEETASISASLISTIADCF